MSNISKEILRDHISHQKFAGSTEVLTAMKGRFKDVIKAPSEAEMDSQLGATWWVVKDELNCFIMIRYGLNLKLNVTI